MSEWQPIETAPEGRCIVHFSDGDIIMCHPKDWINEDGDDYWPTHWMPMPAPPNSGGTE